MSCIQIYKYLAFIVMDQRDRGVGTGESRSSLRYYHDRLVIADFTTLGRSHIYGLPYPSAESLDPMDLYYVLMFQDHPQKFPIYTYT